MRRIAVVTLLLLWFVLVFAGTAVALPADYVKALGSFGTKAQPVIPTAVVAVSPSSSDFASSVRTALESYPVVYLIDTNPRLLDGLLPSGSVSADVVNARATAIVQGEKGNISGLAVIATDPSMTLPDTLDLLTDTVNRSLQVESVKEFQSLEVLTSAYYSTQPLWFYWAGGNNTKGISSIHVTGRCLLGETDSQRDYWVAEIIQGTNPGWNISGSMWSSRELRTKYWKNGNVTTIYTAQPTGTQSGGTVAYTIGWPPSLSYSYPIADVTVKNESVPTNGYARWVHTFNSLSAVSKQYYEAKPSYSAYATQGGSFSAYVYVTAVWDYFGIHMPDDAFPPFAFTLPKPTY